MTLDRVMSAMRRPTRWAVGRRSTRVFTISQIVFAGAWTVVAPWALPMFVEYGYLHVRHLRRHRTVSSGPNLVEQLAGRISAVHLVPLLLIVPTASLSYLAIWQIVARTGELAERSSRVAHDSGLASPAWDSWTCSAD